MDVLYEWCCGLDVHKHTVVACVPEQDHVDSRSALSHLADPERAAEIIGGSTDPTALADLAVDKLRNVGPRTAARLLASPSGWLFTAFRNYQPGAHVPAPSAGAELIRRCPRAADSRRPWSSLVALPITTMPRRSSG